jgi:hypothetical protein
MTRQIALTFEERARSLMRDLRETSSATVTLSRWAGFPLMIDLLDATDRPVTRWEAFALDAPHHTRLWCRDRSGVLRAAQAGASALVVAEVTSTVLLERLPSAVRDDLSSAGGVPLGIALARHAPGGDYHVRRHCHVRRVRATGVFGEPIAIRARSRIDVRGVPVALTEELVPTAFVHYSRSPSWNGERWNSERWNDEPRNDEGSTHDRTGCVCDGS